LQGNKKNYNFAAQNKHKRYGKKDIQIGHGSFLQENAG
jgi:hypothetical protein